MVKKDLVTRFTIFVCLLVIAVGLRYTNSLGLNSFATAEKALVHPAEEYILPSDHFTALALMSGVASSTFEIYIPEPNVSVEELGNLIREMKAKDPRLNRLFIATTTIFAKELINSQVLQMRTGVVDQHAGDLNYNKGVAPWLGWFVE